MERILKRVPLDFSWPIGKEWPGYLLRVCMYELDGSCEDCREFAVLRGMPISALSLCPDFEQMTGPPHGGGYQIWETTTAGSPKSPVFDSLDALCEWAEGNISIEAGRMASRERWKRELQNAAHVGGTTVVPLSRSACGFDSIPDMTDQALSG